MAPRKTPMKTGRRPTRQNMRTNSSNLVGRQSIAYRLGKSFGGDRDIYKALGYKLNLTFDDFMARFQRQDIAKRIIEAFPKATWRMAPDVTEPDSEGVVTQFEEAWQTLVDEFQVYNYLNRADILAGVGEFGLLFMGFDDGSPSEQPVESARRLLFLKPISQGNVTIHQYNEDPTNPRFGWPETYQVQVEYGDGKSHPMNIHYTRVLHIAEGCLENDIFGMPRLMAVFNRLEDVARLSGGSAEMFWRGAFQGLAFKADQDADYTSAQDLEGLEDEISAYVHGLQRYLRFQGVDVQQLSPTVADPNNHFDLQLQLISGATGIPKRILLGSEQGELASTQDENNWLSRVAERQVHFADPVILRPFVQRLIDVGVLPTPANGFDTDWPDLQALSEKEQADIGLTRANTIKAYASTPGADMVLPPDRFLTDVLGYTKEEAEEMQQTMIDEMEMERQEAQAAAEAEAELNGDMEQPQEEPEEG
jgi:hypothetical protein